MKIYIDGQYFSPEEARIPVLDHGFLYGDGIFEGLRIYGGRIFRLRDHVQRLFASARAIALELGKTPDEIAALLEDAVRVNQKQEGYIRLIVSRGDGLLGVDPATCQKSRLVIIVGDIQIYPEQYYRQGIELMISSYRRIPVDCFDVRIKSLNYLNNVLAKMEARRAGCLESVMLDHNGYVAECTGDNIFTCRNGVMRTPPAHMGALEGVTRAAAIALAEEIKIPVCEQPLTRYDLVSADECFLTGTAAEIMPVVKVDGCAVGNGQPGAITKRLMDAFQSLVRKGS